MKHTTPLEAKIRVHGIIYDQIETKDIKIGDLVFDTYDNTYGVCDMIIGNRIAIKDGPVAEVGVPISRVRKLIPSTLTNSQN